MLFAKIYPIILGVNPILIIMGKIRLLSILFVLWATSFLLASAAWAKEGAVELKSTTGAASRCFAASILLQSSRYRIVVSCRDLIYPPAQELLYYVLWANTEAGGNPTRLGDISFGKAEFTFNRPFTSLFVTKEANARPRGPSENVVMRGEVRPISFLEGPAPEPTVAEAEEVPAKETPSKTQAGARNIFTTILLLVFIGSFILIGIGGLIFFILRARE